MNPITFRPTPNDAAIIARIIEAASIPGVKVTQSDAIRIALATWAGQHKEDEMNNRMAYEAEPETIDRALLAEARALVDQTGMGDVDECYGWLVNGDPYLTNLAELWVEYNTQG